MYDQKRHNPILSLQVKKRMPFWKIVTLRTDGGSQDQCLDLFKFQIPHVKDTYLNLKIMIMSQSIVIMLSMFHDLMTIIFK